jgi:hypothetical protein
VGEDGTAKGASETPWHLDEHLRLGRDYRLRDGSTARLISRDTMYIRTSQGIFHLPEFLRQLDPEQFLDGAAA